VILRYKKHNMSDYFVNAIKLINITNQNNLSDYFPSVISQIIYTFPLLIKIITNYLDISILSLC